MAHAVHEGSNGFTVAVRSVVSVWALIGGMVLLAVVVVNMASVIGGMFGHPFPGDFELTEIGVAIAAFAFLPYCQVVGANVTADIFTSAASPRWVAFLTMLGGIVALLFTLVLIWRMYFGMLDQKAYNYTTAILQIPHWIAYAVILVSLALLVLAALATIVEEGTAMKNGGGHV
ncbi:TRAP transporter small permease [Palleronia sp.]|uniref:TRAP transporter small permease n=1 Tax=Palleronia sp. TaxID=1940284 RepID=UPI0035C7CC4F